MILGVYIDSLLSWKYELKATEALMPDEIALHADACYAHLGSQVGINYMKALYYALVESNLRYRYGVTVTNITPTEHSCYKGGRLEQLSSYYNGNPVGNTF